MLNPSDGTSLSTGVGLELSLEELAYITDALRDYPERGHHTAAQTLRIHALRTELTHLMCVAADHQRRVAANG